MGPVDPVAVAGQDVELHLQAQPERGPQVRGTMVGLVRIPLAAEEEGQDQQGVLAVSEPQEPMGPECKVVLLEQPFCTRWGVEVLVHKTLDPVVQMQWGNRELMALLLFVILSLNRLL